MQIHTIKTHLIQCGESLTDILDRYISSLSEASIVVISSKIVSLCQNRVVSKIQFPRKYDLIKQEADAYLAEEEAAYDVHLAIKNNILIPFAGIDESNGLGVYILYPENIQETAQALWRHLKEKHQLNALGIVITDSHITPLRSGVTGIALGWSGFKPLHNYIGTPDLYGEPLRLTQMNIVDALAASAVFMMGEGAEQTPMAVIENLPPTVQFVDRPLTQQEQSVSFPPEEDLFAPLLRKINWKM